MIYKHPYGIHIDLTKVIVVSEPKFFEGFKVGYEITCQLLNEPIRIARKIREDELDNNKEIPLSLFWKLNKTIPQKEADTICDVEIDWREYFPNSVCYDNLLLEISFFVGIWQGANGEQIR